VRSRQALVLLALAGALAAAEPVRLEAVCPWEDHNGYSPVVVTASADRDVTLTLTAHTMTAEGVATVAIPAGGQARRTVLVPTCGSRWLNFQQLAWQGGGLGGSTGISSRNQHNELALALVDPAESLKLKELGEALNRLPGSIKEEQIQRFAPALMPDRWQGYPAWLTVLLTPAGEAALDNDQRIALARWSQVGGGLAVTTAGQFKAWREQGAAPILADPAVPLAALAERIKATRDTLGWQPSVNPVPGTERVPVTAFVVVALGFALLVGPVNLWWVRKRNARHLFLLTTPLISLATCVALIVVSLLADGISVRRSAVQTVLIDHLGQRAVCWTGVTCFAAFSQSSLTLDGEAKAVVADPEGYDGGGRRGRADYGERLSLDWRSGQLLGGAVVPARINRQLIIVEARPERRRLEIAAQGGGWLVSNGLGVDLLGLTWRDAGGAVWVCDAIAQGQAQPLTRRPSAGGEAALDLPGTITQRSGPALELAWNRQSRGAFAFVARLAAPMDALPGPAATDATPPQVVACGRLIPPGAAKGAP
jgi:hypothetical protein